MEKKEEEQRWTKSKLSCLLFFNLIKVSATNRVDLALEKQRDATCAFCTPLLCFLEAAPLPYIQVANSNLPHPWLRSTTVHVLLDKVWNLIWSQCHIEAGDKSPLKVMEVWAWNTVYKNSYVLSIVYFHTHMYIYRKRTHFRGHNISWVKLPRE